MASEVLKENNPFLDNEKRFNDFISEMAPELITDKENKIIWEVFK